MLLGGVFVSCVCSTQTTNAIASHATNSQRRDMTETLFKSYVEHQSHTSRVSSNWLKNEMIAIAAMHYNGMFMFMQNQPHSEFIMYIPSYGKTYTLLVLLLS